MGVLLTGLYFLLLHCEGFVFLVSCPDLLLGYEEYLFLSLLLLSLLPAFMNSHNITVFCIDKRL